MNVTINVLKILATILVAVCHCWIVCNQEFGFELQDNWQILLKTPAWGGVFMFFTISGYLAQCSIRRYGGANVKQFYLNKLKKVLLPCFIFISLVYLLVEPVKLDYIFIIRLLTCTFNGTGSPIHNIGASWYVFVLMWLFILCPIFNKILDNITKYFQNKNKMLSLLFMLILIGGIGYRILGRILGLEWYSWIYASVIGNIDLFLDGMIVARLQQNVSISNSSLWKKLLYVALTILIISCSVMYFYGENEKPILLSIYRYITPSIYLVLTSSLLCVSKNESRQVYKVNNLAPYTFEFYLWHSVVFSIIAKNVIVENGFMRYIIVLLGGFLITSYLAFIMTKMNLGINKVKK